jgi:putative ABC transport system ATP-binding protein
VGISSFLLTFYLFTIKREFMSLLKAYHITKIVQSGTSTLTILQDISLEVATGKTLAILGASGSGKSTLLSLLAGLDIPNTGYVTYQGKNLSKLSENQRAHLRRGKIGFIFQGFYLIPYLSALENVILAAEIAGCTHPKDKAHSILTRVGLAQRMTHIPKQLSGGEQQRVAIARAYVIQPELLFADEPTGNLDSATGSQVKDLLFELNREFNTTLIFATHDPAIAASCHAQLHLNAGQRIKAPNNQQGTLAQ